MEAGENWTVEENARLVTAYFALLERDLRRIAADEPAHVLNKAKIYRDFGGRSVKSVEFKMRNVSSILEELHYPWIVGLVPANNRQDDLWTAVHDVISGGFEIPIIETPARTLTYAPTPPLTKRNDLLSQHAQAIIRKIDPAQRDAANRTLGRAGEAMVFDMEFKRLTLHMPQRVPDLKWVARDEGDGHGYDIRSFDEAGEERLIEVKTTRGINTTPFFISRNEAKVAEDRGDAYRIYRVFGYDRSPKVFTIKPPLEEAVRLEPHVFSASFR